MFNSKFTAHSSQLHFEILSSRITLAKSRWPRDAGKRYNIAMMQERDIFDERQETKKANYSCPYCRERNDYDVRWLKRVKKRSAPRNLNQHERSQFDKSR